MPFSARNARYLRISAHTVLPLYIYLDDKHTEWMTDYILQRVLADLRPDIGPKLRAESSIYGAGGSANAKKGVVEIHRGDTYQFAYFFRKNEPHAVLIKSRKFIPAPLAIPVKGPPTTPQLSEPTRRKRKREEAAKKTEPKKTARRRPIASSQKGIGLSDSEEAETAEDSDGDENSQGLIIEGEELRRSGRAKKLVAGGYKDTGDLEGSDVEMTDPDVQRTDADRIAADQQGQPAGLIDDAHIVQNETDDTEGSLRPSQRPLMEQSETSGLDSASELGPGFSQDFDIDVEEKPKMAMRVSYQGFTIYDRCLCVVIEPWPPLRDASRAPSRAPSLAPSEMRLSSVAPMDQRRWAPRPSRERTPLFLPEIDPRRSLTPAPLPSRILPPVPLFDDQMEPENQEEDQGSGMMAFSQALKSMGGERAASADEDGNEGDVFLGDADEGRGDP